MNQFQVIAQDREYTSSTQPTQALRKYKEITRMLENSPCKTWSRRRKGRNGSSSASPGSPAACEQPYRVFYRVYPCTSHCSKSYVCSMTVKTCLNSTQILRQKVQRRYREVAPYLSQSVPFSKLLRNHINSQKETILLFKQRNEFTCFFKSQVCNWAFVEYSQCVSSGTRTS